MHAPRSAGGETTATWDALGTTIVMRVTDPHALMPARIAVERELAAVDYACSRFRDDSELTRVNARSGRTHRVSPLLAEALALALRGAALTHGDVDPTIGRALELAGYDRDWALLERTDSQGDREAGANSRSRLSAHAPARVSARVRRGWRVVDFDADARTLRVPAGVRLDVGATAKAWVADRAARAAAAAGDCPALVGVGGDIATAGGAPDGGWRIHVTDDHRSAPSAPGQTIAIRSGGVATSSTTVRRWSARGREMHHIIDPATGMPTDSCWRTVSVAAYDCAQANIAATAAIVRGARAVGWLERLALPSRLVDVDGRATPVAGWPADELAHDALERPGVRA
jgi:thiamine biosynthesis lipoprotein